MIFTGLRTIFSGVRRHARVKLAWHAGVGAWITLFYYGPQHWPLLPAHPAPTLAADFWISFQPAWALVYQSVFIVHTLALWLPREAAAVRGYAISLAGAFACGAVVFWLYPTVSPRPPASGSLLYAWLISAVDGPRNAFPSMHAAMGVLAALAVARHLRACAVSRRWRLALALWWAALLYSTLATRQHRLLDLLAGICLALCCLALPVILTRILRRHESISVSPASQPVNL